ncbi:2,3-diaminopropionate biosynthesis protein SbnA [Burkholderia ubonensis]|uniref:N-(2-amino-2-carboxyethyl)-L-glutamate synthase n=1 Tax=Burkholderia ubonensis subsp. mesacidophila TaxID=265293 RepID=A0A2A4FI85_9BURK|nr:2,3-diaminopropionate biosynthesis protein SbnA [Burkholderia ubonensis]PCE33091.1 2,3-diaminopropionate biosynthesis protein SbnA [Burkholderia ubonensis subsp. mesacidophila]
MIGKSIVDCVGGTPLVRLDRLYAGHHAEVFAKLEMLNPAGSIKDRPARYIVERGLADGTIAPGAHVIESSSGNLAIALAMVCRLKGLRFTAVVDPKISPTNLKILRCYGAGIEQVTRKDSQGGYLETRIARVQEMLAADAGAVWINQYGNPRNWESHFHGEGDEIARALDRPADLLVLGVSTSGTVLGIARRLRQDWPDLRVVAVDAVGSVLFGAQPGPRELPGIGASRVPELLCRDDINAVEHVDDYDAAMGCRRLLDREGIFAGGSSGAVVVAIERLLARAMRPLRIVTLLPDRGERYLDSVYDDDWLARVAAARVTGVRPDAAPLSSTVLEEVH